MGASNSARRSAPRGGSWHHATQARPVISAPPASSTSASTEASAFKKGTRVRATTNFSVDGVEWYAKGDLGVVSREARTMTDVNVKLDGGKSLTGIWTSQLDKGSSGEWKTGTRFRANTSISDGVGGWFLQTGQEGEVIGGPYTSVQISVIFDRWKNDPTPSIPFGEQFLFRLEIVGPQGMGSTASTPGTIPAVTSTSIPPACAPFKIGTRVRVLTRYARDGIVWHEPGDEGVVNSDPAVNTKVDVRLDGGGLEVMDVKLLENMNSREWTKGTRVRAKVSHSDGGGGWLFQKGQQGTVIGGAYQKVQIGVIFDRWKYDFTPGIKLEVKDLQIVDVEAPQVEGAKATASTTPLTSSSTSAAGGATTQRKDNRWGDNCDAPAAGSREFFPSGWTPSRDVFGAIQVFGHSTPAISKLRAKGQQLERQLATLGLTTSAEYASTVFAYTEEDKDTDLYGKLNGACRMPGSFAEGRLEVYRDYLYHMQEAMTTLPNFRGTVYRGIKSAVSPVSYQKGKRVTWQAFASASKSQQVARRFVREEGKRLGGSMFVIKVNTGKEVDALSAYPMEQEVLLKLNFFMTVEAKLEGEAAKKSTLPELAAYEMSDLDVYVLKQV